MKRFFNRKYLVLATLVVALVSGAMVGVYALNKQTHDPKVQVAGLESEQPQTGEVDTASTPQQEAQDSQPSDLQTPAKVQTKIESPKQQSTPPQPPASTPTPPPTPAPGAPTPSMQCVSSAFKFEAPVGGTSQTYTFSTSDGSTVKWTSMFQNIMFSDGSTPMPDAKYWMLLPFTASSYPYTGSVFSFKIKVAPDAITFVNYGGVGASIVGTTKSCSVMIDTTS